MLLVFFIYVSGYVVYTYSKEAAMSLFFAGVDWMISAVVSVRFVSSVEAFLQLAESAGQQGI